MSTRRRAARVAAVVATVAAACACSPARRVQDARTLASTGTPSPSSAGAAPPVATPAPPRAPTDLLERHLAALPLPAVAGGQVVARPVRLEAVEEAVRAEGRAAGRRDLSTLFVFGMVFPSRRPPAETAARFMDAAAEKAALEADESTDVGRIAVPGGEEMRLRLGLLRMGEGPFLYDFRWTVAVRRTARPDGRVTLSYALDEAAPRERVSLFRGFATIEPSGSGSLVREVLVVGSPVSPPFFLKAKVRNAVERILVKRWTRLAQ